MAWPQVKELLSKESEDHIRSLDVKGYIDQLKKVINLRPICLRNLRIAGTLLKTGVEAGLSLW
jgi:hypothetical protein